MKPCFYVYHHSPETGISYGFIKYIYKIQFYELCLYLFNPIKEGPNFGRSWPFVASAKFFIKHGQGVRGRGGGVEFPKKQMMKMTNIVKTFVLACMAILNVLLLQALIMKLRIVVYNW